MAKKKTTKKTSGAPSPANVVWSGVNKAVTEGAEKTLRVARSAAKTYAIMRVPGISGTVRGAKVAKISKEAILKKKPYVKVTTGTQAKNANITLKAAKSKKSGSPKPGTYVRIQKVVNPRQGAAGQASAAGSAAKKKTTTALKPIAGYIAGWEAHKDLTKKKK
jgi:hypothetical protein